MGSLIWNVYTKVTSGPKLDATAKSGMEALQGPRAKDPSKYVMVSVRNNGTARTTLTSVWFSTYDSWWARKRAKRSQSGVVPQPMSSQQVPYQLDVGGEYVGRIKQTDIIEEMLKTGKLWCEICHSWSNKPVQVKVIKPDQPDSRKTG
jgi:hypothetical protein